MPGIDTGDATSLTPAQVVATLIKPLESASAFLAAGPVIYDTDGRPVKLPTVAGAIDLSAEWKGEGEQISNKDVTFSEITLMPSTVKSLKVLTRFSNELARQAVISLEAAIRERLVTSVATTLDKQFLSASDGKDMGIYVKPRGLVGMAGQTVTESDGSRPFTLDHVEEALYKLSVANADIGRATLFIRPKEARQLAGSKDADGRRMLQWDANGAGRLTPFGLRVAVTPHLAANNAVLADMGRVAVARDLDASVKLLTETFGDYDQQALRVVTRYDAGPIDGNAIVKITGYDDDADPEVYVTPDDNA